MIERAENALQIAVLAICAAMALIRALRGLDRAWTLLFLFFGSWLLGDIYWTVSLLFFGQTPQISVVSDLSWYASYIFLYMLLREAAPPITRRETRILPWTGPVFALGIAVFYMRWGEIPGNLIYGALLGFLLFSVIRRLLDGREYAVQRPLCVLILVFCLLEYALWTSSCFWAGETLSNPYFWFDFLLSGSFFFFLPATGRSVAA